MPKTFYTEWDIEDLVKRGVISLVVDDDVVLTDLARDKAMRLGMELVREKPPSAPERPYLSELTSPSASQPTQEAPTASVQAVSKPSAGDDLYQQVYDGVVSKLGRTVDEKLLETIIRRVLHTVAS